MLLQLMVYAKIIYLLMVVISGALCTVEDYVIMSQCAHNKAINLAAEGTVSVTDISQTQNITIVGRPDFVNNNFKIALYAKETQRYLCFNDHWKLVGMKELQDTCYFNEAIVHGYFVFRSVVDSQRRIGFTQRGRAVGPKKIVNDACYMFTKIPTDQFFHQHTHFSAPKTKSTTTKIPKTEYTHTPYSTHVGRGSGGGGGRTRTNRTKKTKHRQDDTVMHNHSGSGQGSGSGTGSGNGNGNKKFRGQHNGNRQRQQKQKQMQQQIRGHSYNLNNPKNSAYLNSSRQNLVLSQHNLNNHTNNKHNNSHNTNNNHPPQNQNHQVRHHHNDPNKIARRQQHDQKQKTKMRQRVRPSPSSSAEATIATATATTKTTKAKTAAATATAITTSLITAKSINSKNPYSTLSSNYSQINPSSVVPTITADNTSASHKTTTSTVVVTKRKGRRRKADKLHKKVSENQLRPMGEYFREQTDQDHLYNSSFSPIFEEEREDYMTSSTDYAWMTNDIMGSSVKPTSASLPSWETWYPSSSTSYTDQDSDYFSVSSASSVSERNADKRLSTTMTDFNKDSISAQPPLPLPTLFSTTLNENSVDTNISPTVTTDLGTTTTNTSTYTETDFWSDSPNDNTDVNMTTIDFAKETSDSYSTPTLENNQTLFNTDEAFHENIKSLSTPQDLEPFTSFLPLTTIENGESDSDILSLSPADSTADYTTRMNRLTPEFTSNRHNNKSSEVASITTTTITNNCASNGSKLMTDCMLATKTTPTVANNHKLKNVEASPARQTTANYQIFKNKPANKKITSSTINIIPRRYDKNTILPETTSTLQHSPTSLLSQRLKALAPTKSLQYLYPVDQSITTSFTDVKPNINPTDITTSTTIAAAKALSSIALSTKSSIPSSLTTRKTLRKSTQRLLATPFHQLTYVRNKDGDIDIDSIDNISIYPDILDNDEPLVKPSTSRLTMISGYLPTSATATLPESIRIAKIKINRERKRMLRLRHNGNFA